MCEGKKYRKNQSNGGSKGNMILLSIVSADGDKNEAPAVRRVTLIHQVYQVLKTQAIISLFFHFRSVCEC